MKKLVLLAVLAISLALAGCANRHSGPSDPAKVQQVQKQTNQSNRMATDSRLMGGSFRGVPLGGRP